MRLLCFGRRSGIRFPQVPVLSMDLGIVLILGPELRLLGVNYDNKFQLLVVQASRAQGPWRIQDKDSQVGRRRQLFIFFCAPSVYSEFDIGHKPRRTVIRGLPGRNT